jgi:hypothetical protein
LAASANRCPAAKTIVCGKGDKALIFSMWDQVHAVFCRSHSHTPEIQPLYETNFVKPKQQADVIRRR